MIATLAFNELIQYGMAGIIGLIKQSTCVLCFQVNPFQPIVAFHIEINLVRNRLTK